MARQCSPSSVMSRSARFASSRHIVQRARDQARGGGLAHAAHAGEHIGLGDAAARKRIAQRLHHGVLADQLGEQLRAGICGRAPRGSDRRKRARGVPSAFAAFLLERFGRALLLIFAFGHGRSDFHAEDERAASSKAGLEALTLDGYRARRWEAGQTTRVNLVRAASFRT